MASRQSSKPDLVALYRLEFYRKKKNWKLCSDKMKMQSSAVAPSVEKNNHKLNETYDVEPKSEIEDGKKSVLNAAFMDEIPTDEVSPTDQLPGTSQNSSPRPPEDACLNKSSVSALEPLYERTWNNQTILTASQRLSNLQAQHDSLSEGPINKLQELLCPKKWPSHSTEDIQMTPNQNPCLETQTNTTCPSGGPWSHQKLQDPSDNWRDLLSETETLSEGAYIPNIFQQENPECLPNNWTPCVNSPQLLCEYNWGRQESPLEAQEFPIPDIEMDFAIIDDSYINRELRSYPVILNNVHKVLETWNNLISATGTNIWNEQAWQNQQSLWPNSEQVLKRYDPGSDLGDDWSHSNIGSRQNETDNYTPEHQHIPGCQNTPEQSGDNTDKWTHTPSTVYKQNEAYESLCVQNQLACNNCEEFIREAHLVPHSSENDSNETVDCESCSVSDRESLPSPSVHRLSSAVHHSTTQLKSAIYEQILKDHVRLTDDTFLEYQNCGTELFAYDKILDGSHLPHVTRMLEMEADGGSRIRIDMGRPYRT